MKAAQLTPMIPHSITIYKKQDPFTLPMFYHRKEIGYTKTGTFTDYYTMFTGNAILDPTGVWTGYHTLWSVSLFNTL